MNKQEIAQNFKDYVENLKKLYGNYYLARLTKEEQEKYINYYSIVFEKDLKEARQRVKQMIKSHQKSIAMATYNSYLNILQTRYGEFYFGKMTSEEKDILVNYYYRALREIGEEVTKEEAFERLFDLEYERCQNRMFDYGNYLDRLEIMFKQKH